MGSGNLLSDVLRCGTALAFYIVFLLRERGAYLPRFRGTVAVFRFKCGRYPPPLLLRYLSRPFTMEILGFKCAVCAHVARIQCTSNMQSDTLLI